MEKIAGTASGRTCPLCRKPLVWRKGRYSTFEGCSDFPRCRGKIGAPRGKSAVSAVKVEAVEAAAEEAEEVEIEIEEVETAEPKPEPTKEESMSSEAPADPLQAAIADAARKHLKPELDALRAKIEGLEGFKPVHHVWKDGETVKIEVKPGSHRQALKLARLYAEGCRNFLIVGPAGSGKTTLAHDFAKSLNKAFWFVSCTAGMSESKLTGKTAYNMTDGTTRHVETGFIRMYREGGVVLLDEADAADANVMLVINSALSNGQFALDDGATDAVPRHPETVVILSANTYGTGPTRQYVGRNQLDAATLDRFVGSIIPVDYDRDIEAKLASELACRLAWKVRDLAEKAGLRRVVSTRFVIALDRALRVEDTKEAALLACTEGWTTEERSKVGISA